MPNKPALAGYRGPYRLQHHPVTSLLTNEQYDRFATLAIRAGLKVSTFATRIIEAELARQTEAAE